MWMLSHFIELEYFFILPETLSICFIFIYFLMPENHGWTDFSLTEYLIWRKKWVLSVYWVVRYNMFFPVEWKLDVT